jgi:hypothetical protein
MSEPVKCEADSFGGLCGAPAEYRGLITGRPLCHAHAAMIWRIGGEGISKIADESKKLVRFDSSGLVWARRVQKPR